MKRNTFRLLLLLGRQHRVLATAASPSELRLPYRGVVNERSLFNIVVGTLAGLVVC